MFYDFEAEKVIDNYYVQKYLEDMEKNPHFYNDEGTLEERIREILPDNHYGPIGDDVLENHYDDIGEMSYNEAEKNIRDKEFEKTHQADKSDAAYEAMDGYVRVNPTTDKE